MILLTGATGLVGSALLPRLTARGVPVRCLVRDPRRLGAQRVRVQIALGDLADPSSFRHALRGVDTVVHLAAAHRDQPGGTVEELTALATWRMARAAERAGVRHFVFFSCLGATENHRSRVLRAKALGARAVREAALPATVLQPSLVYAPGDARLARLARLTWLPAVPIVGRGRARVQPIWVEDVIDCLLAALDRPPSAGTCRSYELAGPDLLDQRAVVATALTALGRPRSVLPVPLGAVRRVLRAVELLAGPTAFETWEEAELLSVPMWTPRGTGDAEALGVRPRRLSDVLRAGV